ncbi:MAG TPA: NAD(P)/FAD-dependent oxidoreductase [Steroidobacter sp.]|uniref:flavin-containing monooxygenase n=1 Tax=Steroidobacter sp. TaxID=1978227 RepID=UPI002ED7BE4E
MPATEHVDVLIVGAGLSGIGAGYRLQLDCPTKSYAILEARDAIGGTWDLFRYPGIRSDSDMYTLGYSFRPWHETKAIADGASILKYVRDTAREYGIDRNIRFNHRVKRAAWSTADALWTVEAQQPSGEVVRFTCNFLFMCSGYYNYDAGYTPELAGTDQFKGRIVHPQKWTDDIEYAGKRVVVIGSGATAVTLVPELAKTAAHVTMLQRSPTYIVARPAEDRIANWLRHIFPAKLAHGITRWKNVLLGMLFYNLCRRAPGRMKQMLIRQVKDELGDSCDVERHFTPRYNPWDQRLCLVPNGDLFETIKTGRASVVTDHIETFTEQGLRLRSGAEIAADLVVTATGLDLQAFGDMQLVVDEQPVELARTLCYKGMMLADVPNFALAFGYTNASWTLKCDLTCEYVCRLLNHMDRQGYRQCTPRNDDASVSPTPWVNFTSGYIRRARGKFPNQGSKRPWRLYQNYALDLATLRFAAVDDGVMRFSSPAAVSSPAAR